MSAATETVWRAPNVSADAAPLDAAILRTLLYASLFEYPLSLDELERRLLGVRADRSAIDERLREAGLRDRIARVDGWIVLRGGEHWVARRRERQRRSEALLARHQRALRLLAGFPFVRLVALSGACAHGNASDEDVDVFLIARRDRAWTVALGLVLLSKCLGVRRSLCVNYVVDERALALPEKDVFTAAEIIALRPLAGREAYWNFLEANSWVSDEFPNFRGNDDASLPLSGCMRLERLLDRLGGRVIEGVARGLWSRRLRRLQGDGIVLTAHRLKLHARCHRPRLLTAFQSALREEGLA